MSETDRQIHILHLSDIHLGTSDQAKNYFTQLATDLTQNLKVRQINYLVLSGDIANYSTIEEYDAAFELVDKLVNRYGLNPDRVITVPGNHDLNWDLSKKSYDFIYKSELPKSLQDGQYIDAGEAGALIRDEERYQQRFKHFSDRFYKKVYGKPYPLEYDQQAILHPCPDDKILFLALNSCWELDHHHKDRASINPNAISHAIDQILVGNYDDWLKIAVWHHPVTSAESMKNVAFLEQLATNGFQVAMHGHIHEAKDENFQYDTNRGLRIIAAGTFGAPAKEQVAGIPLQYNLLVLNPDNGELTVETRKKEKVDGAWSADARWGDKNNPMPRYTIFFQKTSNKIDCISQTSNIIKIKSKPSIFISYSHEDIDKNLFDYLNSQISERLRNKINIHIDKKLNLGDNLAEFMNLLNTVDAVIIYATPSYKRKIKEKEGSVYKEFTIILNRYKELREINNENNSDNISCFKIIPIITSGDKESSLPESLYELLYCDLSNIKYNFKYNKFNFSSHERKEINESLSLIEQSITTSVLQNSQDFKQSERKFSDNLKIDTGLFADLFNNTKFSSATINDIPPFYDALFVQTPEFNDVVSQKSYFIIGRKGSGKSTITGAVAMRPEKEYKGFIAISAESINLKYLYGEITFQTNQDKEYILSPYTFFQVAWDGFICLSLVKLLVDLETNNKLQDCQNGFIFSIKEFYQSFLDGFLLNISGDEEAQRIFFEKSFDAAQSFLASIIEEANPNNDSISDLRLITQAKFTSKQFLLNLFGTKTYEDLLNLIFLCNKKILVTVDNFDTKFDLLRRDALDNKDELVKRHQFENEWLHAIMLRVLDLKDLRKAINTPFSSMDFCLTIPKDRFIFIEKRDRDAYRFDNRLTKIRWSGLDLCKILIKRLCFLTNHKLNNDISLDKQLEELIENYYPRLPTNLEFDYGGKKISIPLFCYVLRHSFWRPRDILKIFSKLLAASQTYQGKSRKIPFHVIKTLVNDTAYTIIKTEFNDEYYTTIPNIKEITNSFLGKIQILNEDEMHQHLSTIQHLFIIYDTENIPIRTAREFTFRKQIELLFDIGFLGIVFLKEENTIYSSNTSDDFSDHFYFNEGSRAFHRVADARFKEAKFIIHPIFWDNLFLKPYNGYFSHHYTWEYLYDNGAMTPYRA